MSAQVEIRTLTAEDLARVVAIHVAAFPTSVLTRLGREAVRRYYEWQLLGPHDVYAIGAFSEEAMVGYCFAGIFRGAISGYVRKNRVFLLGRLIARPWVLLSADVRSRVPLGVGALRMRRRRSGEQNVKRPRSPSYGILAIAVDPAQGRTGVGRRLMTAVEERARSGGFEQLHLTVAVQNSTAIRFYEKLGWVREEAEAGWQGRMRKALSAGGRS